MSSKRASQDDLKAGPYDPAPAARLAARALRGAQIPGALAGRIAVWQYVSDPSQRGPADALIMAVQRAVGSALAAWLERKGFHVESHSNGGVCVSTDQGVSVHFVHGAGRAADVSGLYASAVAAAHEQERLAQVGEEALFLAPPEHLLAMELAGAGREHERDARRLLARPELDVEKLRQLLHDHVGTLGVSKLDLLLPEVRRPGRHAR